MDKITIRKAKAEEFKIIQELNHRLFVSDNQYGDTLNINWAYEKEGIKYFKDAISNKNYICLLAEIDGEVVGYLIGYLCDFESWKPVEKAELESIFVKPEYRSQGVGEKLAREFINWSKAKGAQRVKVGAASKNEKAIKFYQRLGFIPDQLYLEREV